MATLEILCYPDPRLHKIAKKVTHFDERLEQMVSDMAQTRPDRVKVRAQNLKGEYFEIDAEGIMSVCIQHEMDHLIGKVFVEYLSPLKRARIKGKMKKKFHH